MNSRVYGGENNAVFRDRVKAEGRWSEFTEFRSLLKARLISEFPDWSEDEFRQAVWLQCREAFSSADMADKEKEILAEKAAVRSRLPMEHEEDGSKSESEQLVAGVKAREIPVSSKAALLAAGGRLDSVGGVQDDVEWVYQHLDVPWSGIDVEGVPSRGAVGLLATAKTDPAWFYQTYHAKLLPTKSQVEAEGWFRADEGRIEEMVKLVVDDRELKKLREAVDGE